MIHMKHEVLYEHLENRMIRNVHQDFLFNQVRDTANKYELHLSEKKFEYFMRLKGKDVDIDWIMNVMVKYDEDMLGALVSYVSY